jgi:hypothetical protein
MKLINKIRNNKAIVILSLCSTFILSCSDYLDVDKDTDYPTTAPLNLLLTNVEINTALLGDFNNNTGRLLSTYTHQMTSREEEDQYGIKVGNISMNNDWDAIYLALTDIETIIKKGTDTDNMVYVGIAQMQKAYIMSYAVDLWGDVPYSEATQLATSGIINPKFDNQKEIYSQVFALIETAKVNLASNSGTEIPSDDDLYYGGDTDKIC